jgi:hypothetical protein
MTTASASAASRIGITRNRFPSHGYEVLSLLRRSHSPTFVMTSTSYLAHMWGADVREGELMDGLAGLIVGRLL